MLLNLLSELDHYAIHECNRIGISLTIEQRADLQFIALYHESGLCASRGYGKTMLLCIYESFMALRHWHVAHLAKELAQLDQWYIWMYKLGWKVTMWNARLGSLCIDVRLYRQGRGPRYDIIGNDEVGTVISDIEVRYFMQSQEMLSGSKLGKSCWIGTQDPNSVWVKCKHTFTRGFYPEERPQDAIIMPWILRQYLSAAAKNPAWYMDQEYHCLATPAGGLVLTHCILRDHTQQTRKFGIDVNPAAGYYVVGSAEMNSEVFLTEAHIFLTLKNLADFILAHPEIPFELEMNGPGGVVAQYFRENQIPFYEFVTTDQSKIDRVNNIAMKPIYVPKKYENDVLRILLKQIWKDKKIEKFADAHYFDAFWLSTGEISANAY